MSTPNACIDGISLLLLRQVMELFHHQLKEIKLLMQFFVFDR